MRKLIIVILLFLSIGLFAQNQSSEEIEKVIISLEEKVIILKKENGKLKNDIGVLKSELSTFTVKLDSLQRQSNANGLAIKNASAELGSKITTTEINANQKITHVDELVTKTSLYGIIGLLIAFILSGSIYWLVSKRQKTDRTDIIEKLSNTKSAIEESLIKEFGKQTELMDAQLHDIEQQKTTVSNITNVEPDHSFALKVASEINLIERNINLMDTKTRGLKQLHQSIGKLKDNLCANGYEMPQLLHKPFNQGMKVIVVSSIPDENLSQGSEIITKVLIPQVNYNYKMIQTAQIEVSVGY